jgi:hypothetical protein
MNSRDKKKQRKKTNKSQAWWHMPLISATQELEVGESRAKSRPDKSVRPYLKKHTKKQNDWEMPQVEHLCSKHKALSVIPCMAKIKMNRKYLRQG